MLDNTVEISTALNALAQEGLIPTIDELAALSPFQTRHIQNVEPEQVEIRQFYAIISAGNLQDNCTYLEDTPKIKREENPMDAKSCGKCGIVKPLSDFAMNKGAEL